MDPLQLVLAALSGGIVALLLTVFGGGGSVLAVPLLLYVVGVRDPHMAIGASAAGVSLNALTALAGQAKAGRVRWPCAVLFAAVGSAAAWIGSSAAKAIDGNQLLLAFAVAMAAVGLVMLRPKKNDGDPGVRLNRGMTPRVVASSAGVGVAAGFFGIGGGFLIVPGLMWATGMTLAAAQATSLLSVAAFGASTAVELQPVRPDRLGRGRGHGGGRRGGHDGGTAAIEAARRQYRPWASFVREADPDRRRLCCGASDQRRLKTSGN